MLLPPEEPDFSPWRLLPLAALLDLLPFELSVSSPASSPVVLAVDGRSGSGKTTLAGAIAGMVPGAVVVHTDDVAWHHSFFDWAELLLAGVLEPARAGRAVDYRPAAWRERSREGGIRVGRGCPLLIVEGVGAARRELLGALDGIVWVQADLAQARARGVARDGGAEAVAFWDEWMAAEMPFLADQRPWERADLVVAGTPPGIAHDPDAQVVVSVR